MSNITESKTATEVLFEHGIEMTDNDTFNCQLLNAMERYAESKAALQNKVNNSHLLELVKKVTDILEVMDLKDNNRKALLKIKMGLQSILQENKVSNEVEITSTCKDPNCEYCHGTGEIKIDNPTSMIISYCACFGNGVMSSVPHREEQYKNEKVSDISAEEILYKHILADSEKQMSGDNRLVIKDPPFEEIVKNPTFQMHVAAMEEYASIVNKRKDSAGSDAIEFTEWVGEQGLVCFLNSDGIRRWYHLLGNDKPLTTKELYKSFQESKTDHS